MLIMYRAANFWQLIFEKYQEEYRKTENIMLISNQWKLWNVFTQQTHGFQAMYFVCYYYYFSTVSKIISVEQSILNYTIIYIHAPFYGLKNGAQLPKNSWMNPSNIRIVKSHLCIAYSMVAILVCSSPGGLSCIWHEGLSPIPALFCISSIWIQIRTLEFFRPKDMSGNKIFNIEEYSYFAVASSLIMKTFVHIFHRSWKSFIYSCLPNLTLFKKE